MMQVGDRRTECNMSDWGKLDGAERLLYPVDLKLLTATQRFLVSCVLVFRKSSDLLRHYHIIITLLGQRFSDQ